MRDKAMPIKTKPPTNDQSILITFILLNNLANKIKRILTKKQIIDIWMICTELALKAKPAPRLSRDKAKAKKTASKHDNLLELSASAFS